MTARKILHIASYLALLVVATAVPETYLARAVVAQAAEAIQLFDEGNRLYEAGEYSRAADAYERALASGRTSMALYYNLGNAYYRLDDVGRAILNYERALVLEPESRPVQHSLALARTRTMDRMSQLPEPVWTRAWRRVTGIVGLGTVLWVGLALYLAGFGVLIYRILSGRTDNWTRRAATILVAAGVPAVLVALASSNASDDRPRCVVIERSVAVRASPDSSAQTELDVHAGLVVKKIGATESWLRVQLPNGVTGWVDGSTVERI